MGILRNTSPPPAPARSEFPAADLEPAFDSTKTKTGKRLLEGSKQAVGGAALGLLLGYPLAQISGFMGMGLGILPATVAERLLTALKVDKDAVNVMKQTTLSIGALLGLAAAVPVGLGLAAAGTAVTAPVAGFNLLARLAQTPGTISAKAEFVPAPQSPYSGLFASGAPCLLSVVVGRAGSYLRVDAFGTQGSRLVCRAGDSIDAQLAPWAKVRADDIHVNNVCAPHEVTMTTECDTVSRTSGSDWRKDVHDSAGTAWQVYAQDSSAQGRHLVGTLRLDSEWVASAYGDQHLT